VHGGDNGAGSAVNTGCREGCPPFGNSSGRAGRRAQAGTQACARLHADAASQARFGIQAGVSSETGVSFDGGTQEAGTAFQAGIAACSRSTGAGPGCDLCRPRRGCVNNGANAEHAG
jgi:hypothetical protein